jgi:hypothetical protein
MDTARQKWSRSVWITITEIVVAGLLAYPREHIDGATRVLSSTLRSGTNLNDVTYLHVDVLRNIEKGRRSLFVWATTALDSPHSDTSIMNIRLADTRSLKRPYSEVAC